MSRSSCQLLLTLSTVLALPALAVEADPRPAEPSLHIENERLAIQLDNRTGGLVEIRDKRGDATYRIDDPSFRIEVGQGATPGSFGFLTPDRCRLTSVNATPTEARYIFEMPPFTLTLVWHLDAEDDFAVKRARIEYAGRGQFNVRRFEMFDWSLAPRPDKAIPYYGFLKPSVTRNLQDGDEPLPADTSTAFFFRYRDRGLFSALTCDFVQMKEDAASGRYRSTYWPGFILDAGQAMESEGGIVGVYERKGMFHEPYQPTSKLGDFLRPNVDTRLDRGEIDAMSAAVRNFVKPGVYRTLVNGWGVGLPWLIESQEAADLFKQGIDTLVKIPAIEALHFVHSWCGLAREFRDQGLAVPIAPNRYADEVFLYAREKGIGLSMFIGISNNYPMHKEGPSLTASTELLSQDEKGQPRPNNIAISRPYADFIVRTVTGICQKYPVVGLSYDFLGIQPDYATGHGYLLGRASLLPQYAFLRDVNRRLRQRFPDLMLRGQVGWMWFGPWLAENMSLCHNATDHNIARQRNFLDCHVDHQFANNIRLSNWFTNNCKMHPRHKMNSNSLHNGSQFRAWDYGAWQYAILSQIASGDMFGMLHDLPDEAKGEIFRTEDGRFFQKWIEWQKAHREYYLRENDLFGEPRPTGLDGYAYGNGRDSVVFVCNPTFQTHSAAIPLGAETHLPAGASYRVKELYPEERYRIGPEDGVFPFDSQFVTDVPPQTVMVFEITPDNPDEPLLLGVEGKLSAVGTQGGTANAQPDGFRLTDVSGPSGKDRLIAVRLPRTSRASTLFLVGPICNRTSGGTDLTTSPLSSVSPISNRTPSRAGGEGASTVSPLSPCGRGVAGERLAASKEPPLPIDLPTRRSGRLLLARLHFNGDPIDPEIRDWKARREGGRLKIDARFDVPASAKAVLASQNFPISSDFRSAEWLDRTEWLGSNRFIIHIPIVPAGYEADSLRGKQAEEVEAKTQPRAMLNGKSVPVHSNLMGTKQPRWSGFFIDATDLVEYGKTNTLALDLYQSPENQCFGLYLPNLTPQRSAHATPLDPPSGLTLTPAPEAADALPVRPLVRQDGDRLTLWVRLRLTARPTAFWNPRELTVSGGRLLDQAVLDADPRWTPREKTGTGSEQANSPVTIAASSEVPVPVLSQDTTARGEIVLGSKVKTVLLAIEGTRATQFHLGTDPAAPKLTLGDILDAWKSNADPYNPRATTIDWKTKGSTVEVDLVGPWGGKRRVEGE